MVKKLFYLFSAVAAILTMASCSNEADDLISNASESVENVTLTVNVPEAIQSRAVNSDVTISSGSCINKLHFAMYLTGTKTVVYTSEEAEGVHYKNMVAEYDNDSKTFSISLPYVPKSQGFDIVFWACHEEDAYKVYTFDCTTQSVSINYDGIKNNEEKRDAFFTSEKNVMLSESNGKTITLRRPFAQLNIGTNDVAGAKQAGLIYSGIEVKVKKVYSKLNLLTGIASEAVDVVTFAASEANDAEMNPWPLEDQAGYSWISMNYVLTGSELLGEDAEDENLKDVNEVNKAKKENMDVEFTLYGTNKANQAWSKSYPLSAIPFQRNYRTFITGQLCTTSDDQLKVHIAPDFYDQYVENLDPKEYH